MCLWENSFIMSGEIPLNILHNSQQDTDTVNFYDELKQYYPTLQSSSKALRLLLCITRKHVSCNPLILPLSSQLCSIHTRRQQLNCALKNALISFFFSWLKFLKEATQDNGLSLAFALSHVLLMFLKTQLTVNSDF